MNVREPRFLIIDLHKRQVVPATTDEMQALLRREELTGEAYFQRVETTHDPETSAAEHSVSSL